MKFPMVAFGWIVCGAVAASAVGCDRPEADVCRRACWNGFKLQYWEGVEDQVRDLPLEEAAKARARAEAEFREIQLRVEDARLLNCVMDCQHAGDSSMAECGQNASTASAFRECIK